MGPADLICDLQRKKHRKSVRYGRYIVQIQCIWYGGGPGDCQPPSSRPGYASLQRWMRRNVTVTVGDWLLTGAAGPFEFWGQIPMSLLTDNWGTNSYCNKTTVNLVTLTTKNGQRQSVLAVLYASHRSGKQLGNQISVISRRSPVTGTSLTILISLPSFPPCLPSWSHVSTDWRSISIEAHGDGWAARATPKTRLERVETTGPGISTFEPRF